MDPKREKIADEVKTTYKRTKSLINFGARDCKIMGEADSCLKALDDLQAYNEKKLAKLKGSEKEAFYQNHFLIDKQKMEDIRKQLFRMIDDRHKVRASKPPEFDENLASSSAAAVTITSVTHEEDNTPAEDSMAINSGAEKAPTDNKSLQTHLTTESEKERRKKRAEKEQEKQRLYSELRRKKIEQEMDRLARQKQREMERIEKEKDEELKRLQESLEIAQMEEHLKSKFPDEKEEKDSRSSNSSDKQQRGRSRSPYRWPKDRSGLDQWLNHLGDGGFPQFTPGRDNLEDSALIPNLDDVEQTEAVSGNINLGCKAKTAGFAGTRSKPKYDESPLTAGNNATASNVGVSWSNVEISETPNLAGDSETPRNGGIGNVKTGNHSFRRHNSKSPETQLRQDNVRSLPKWKLQQFSGDPLEWPEWSGMFQSTIGLANISKDEKMNHLKSLLTGLAQRAVRGMGFTGAMYDVAWQTLQRKFGQPHMVISSQLAKLSAYPTIRVHDSSAIVEYADILLNFVNILQQFNYASDLYSSTNLELAVSKLPPDLKKNWYSHINKMGLYQPNLLQLSDWVQREAEVHDRLLYTSKWTKQPDKTQGARPKQTSFPAGVREQKPKKCPLGDGDHQLWKCEKFKSLKVSERYDAVKRNKLCFNCLGSDHLGKDCKFKPCGVDGCDRRHNRLLHVPAKASTETKGTTTLASQNLRPTRGLLQVAEVQIYQGENSWITYAVCDTGSTKTWIDAAYAQTIGLKSDPSPMVVTGIHGTRTIDAGTVSLKLGPVGTGINNAQTVEASTLPRLELSDSIYDYDAMKQSYCHLDCLPSGKVKLTNVKIILGQDCFSLIRPIEYRSSTNKLPWAVRTPLGWTVSGPLPTSDKRQCTQMSYFLDSENDRTLGEQIKMWWDMESYASSCSVKSRSKEDKRAEAILQETTKFIDGRYEVGLLWGEDLPQLPNNYYSAMGQLNALEKRFSKNDQLAARYAKTIEDDLENGYIRTVDNDELAKTKDMLQWFLPHHPVVNPHKPEKVRRVCNAASKQSGRSLNDNLLAGPDLLRSLVGVLFRFRRYPIAVSADIEAMFLQVAVPNSDQRCLRFLWRRPGENKAMVYQYQRHIFGAKSSPTCANHALQQCARDNETNYPQAAQAVFENFYMDDLLLSCKDEQTATSLASSLGTLLKLGGFNLTKWVSNNEQVSESLRAQTSVADGTETLAILGMHWCVLTDHLKLCRGLDVQHRENWTHRAILSTVSAIFDPIGLAAPFTIRARILLKEIWKDQGQQWDSKVKDSLNTLFQAWAAELPKLRQLQVPRWYHNSPEATGTQLHIFADASQDAFSVVAYLRAEHRSTCTVAFIIGKSRVAPMKYTTIPKLELQAAVTAVRLKNNILEEQRIDVDSIHFWSDSTTVIQWLQNSDKKQPVFVANRVTEILESSTVDEWNHVPGEFNPADCGTRGLTVESLVTSMWLTGPAWLSEPSNCWPNTLKITEVKEVSNIQFVATEKAPLIKWSNFSKFTKLRNTVAWIRRFCGFSKLRSQHLSAVEIHTAEKTCWKLVQSEAFEKELTHIRKDKSLPALSRLKNLLPFLDGDGLLRTRGRLGKSSLSFDAKHPVILDGKHLLVKYYLRYVHERNHHEGLEYLRSVVQQSFWILGLRNELRMIKHQCIQCRKFTAQAEVPIMADLPSERLDARTYPFRHTGIDYFGPFEVKLLRRSMKRWCCLFTCLTTRAVHIEVVHTMDTDSCLQAITRFIARRGQPETIISDNGTNFVGANREFKEYIDSWNHSLMDQTLSQQKIRWKFNPPGAPHFGGVWERLVRSCKKAMINVLQHRRLTDETLRTTMCIVEQILNARPITPVSSDPEDLEALTPNHFLIGRASIVLPKCIHSTDKIDYRKAYRNSELYSDMVWTRWLNEYLPQFNIRQKWYRDDNKQLMLGDLVWVVDAASKRCDYMMGRIIDNHPGRDGNVRSVTLKTSKGILKRPVAKLIPLDVQRPLDETVFTPKKEHGAGDVEDGQ